MKINVNGKDYNSALLITVIVGIIVVLLIITATIGFNVGETQGKTQAVDEVAVRALTKIKEENDSELTETKQIIENNRETLKAIDDYNANKEQFDKEISDKFTKLEQLNADVGAKQAELDLLTGEVTKAKSAPKTLSAGQFVVGTDLPVGRYNVSGSSNFIVYEANGRLKVNTILGNSGIGKGDYVCTLTSGDQMDLHGRTTFTPIQ